MFQAPVVERQSSADGVISPEVVVCLVSELAKSQSLITGRS